MASNPNSLSNFCRCSKSLSNSLCLLRTRNCFCASQPVRLTAALTKFFADSTKSLICSILPRILSGYATMFLFSLLDTVLLSLAHCMLIATYLFELAAHAQLHCYDIHTPRPLATGMLIEIVVRYLFNLLLLASSNCLLRQTISRAPPRF